MGRQDVKPDFSAEQIRLFEKSLLEDIRALEYMLDSGMFETDVARIGAEQEVFLLDNTFRPKPVAMTVLERLNDKHFTTELGSFNIEFNLDPIRVSPDCLSVLQARLENHLAKLRLAASKEETQIYLGGILPTLNKSDLTLSNMTPRKRYYALNQALNAMRGRHYELFLRGTDELYIKHDSVMLEACNASFQIHFQVQADDFAKYYNAAQAVAGPVLACSVNSPVLFGRRLWHETRIGVFQQSTDTRNTPRHIRQISARVNFGREWVKESVLEIFKEDIARFRVLLGIDRYEKSMELLDKGKIPKLSAFQMHNSTVYRWTRPCYGITDGKPHLRIENRLFPSGPTVIDEVANAALWFGIIIAVVDHYGDVTKLLDFDDAKSNFYAAARRGLKCQFTWFDGNIFPAQDLVGRELLPLARSGLQKLDIQKDDIDRYLGIIQERISLGRNGSEWCLNSYSTLRCQAGLDKCMTTLTEAACNLQQENKPVHEWPLAKLTHSADLATHYQKVEQFMTTDLFTVGSEDTIELLLSVMKWRRIRHIPVEDNKSQLVGLVNYRSLLELVEQRMNRKDKDIMQLPVREVMQTKVPTVEPLTPTLKAIALMRKTGSTCLPVVHENRLVGIITEHDFMKLSGQFLEAANFSHDSE